MFEPFAFFDELDLARIRRQSVLCETQGQLTEDLIALLVERRWLRILQPKSVGGCSWSFPMIVRFFEAVTWADANVGWVLNLGAGANLFAGYLPHHLAKTVFSSDRTFCAGSGAASGRAERAPGGYRVSGHWKYASGSAHATHITANCVLFENGRQCLQPNGEPLIRSFLLPVEAVSILPTWKVTGLKGTSSNDFEILDQFVPEDWTFSLKGPSTVVPEPLFQFPFDVLAVVNMAIMPVAIAMHFLDLFEELMRTKRPTGGTALLGDQRVVSERFVGQKTRLAEARRKMYERIELVWAGYAQGHPGSRETELKLVQAARMAAEVARDVFFALYPYCGMSVAFEGTSLNKVWRDFSVATQHVLLR